MSDRDDDLRTAFAALRAEDADRAPPLEHVLGRAEARRRPRARPVRWLLAATAAAALGGLLLRSGAPPEAPGAVRFEPGRLRVPSDVLLELPGQDLLGTAPRPVVPLPPLPGPPERSARPPWRTLS